MNTNSILMALMSVKTPENLSPFVKFDSNRRVLVFGYERIDHHLPPRSVICSCSEEFLSDPDVKHNKFALDMLKREFERRGIKFTQVCNGYDRYQ